MSEKVCGTGWGNFPKPGDPDLNNSILNAVPAFGGIDVFWTYPELLPHAVSHVVLYRSTNADPATRVKHRKVSGEFFYDKVNPEKGITYYYWIEIVSVNGTVGDLIGPASAMARPTIEQTIELLTGQITKGQLGSSLNADIDRIPVVERNLADEAAARLELADDLGAEFAQTQANVDSVAELIGNEVDARIAADTETINNLNQVYTELDEERTLRVAAIQQEIKDRKDALLQEAVDRNAAIEAEALTRSNEDKALAEVQSVVSAALNTNTASLFTLEQARVDSEEAVMREISQLETVMNDNTAAILNEAQTRSSADSALASELSVISAKLDAKPTYGNEFESGLGYPQWVVPGGNTLSADTSGPFLGTQAGLIGSSKAAPDPTVPDVVYAPLPAGFSQGLAGFQIKISLAIKKPASNASVEMGIGYQTPTQFSGWERLAPTTSWVIHEFTYLIPDGDTENHKLLIWGDTSGGGKAVLVDRILAQAAEAEVSSITAELTEERNARVDADSALGQRIDTVEASVGDNASSITSEATTRANEDSALGQRIDLVVADAKDNSAAIATEQTARANADSALAEGITTLTAATEENAATLSEEASTRAEDDEVQALLNRVLAASTKVSSGVNRTREIVRVNDNEALSQRIDFLGSQFEENAAYIQTVETAMANADSALASQMTTLFAEANENTATLLMDYETAVEAEQARASLKQGIQSDYEGHVSTVLQDYETASSAEQARATLKENLEATMDGLSEVRRQPTPPSDPSVNTFWIDSSDGDASYMWDGDQWVPTDLSTVQDTSAAIQENNQAVVGYCSIDGSPDPSITTPGACSTAGGEWKAATPLAEAVKGVQIQDATGSSANVEQRMIAYRNELGYLQSQVTLKVEVDPNDPTQGIIKGGLGLGADGETGEVEAGFDVDRFWVGKLGNKKYPFIIDGQEVFIDEAVIRALTFNKLRADDGSFIVENGKLKADNIDATNLKLDYGNIENVDISSADIRNGAITSAKIGNAAINTAKIANGQITSAKIANGQITSAKIGNAEVDTLQIRGNAVTMLQAQTDGSRTGGANWVNVISFTYYTGASDNIDALVTWGGKLRGGTAGEADGEASLRLVVAGVVRGTRSTLGSSIDFSTSTKLSFPNTGVSIRVQYSGNAIDSNCRNVFATALGLKR